MAIRNATSNFTFEQWRVEFNELAADVGDISAGITGSVPSGAGAASRRPVPGGRGPAS